MNIPEHRKAVSKAMRVQTATRQSRLTQDNAARLSEEIKSDWWKANRSRFTQRKGK